MNMELFRTFKNKKFIAAVILLLLLNCVFFYITQQRSISDLGVNIGTYSKVFRENADVFSSSDAAVYIGEKNREFQILKAFSDSERMKAEHAEEYEYFAEEEARLIQENPLLYQEFKNGKYSDAQLSATADFYARFAYQLEYQNGYQAYIDSVLENGTDLLSKKLFSDENSFSYKSIQKSTADFEKNRNLTVSLVNDLPVRAVFSYQVSDFVLILISVFLAVSFSFEKNVNLLINTCKKGRCRLKIKQLPILIGFSVFISFVIYTANILLALKIYDVPMNWNAPIQSSDMFADCIMHINFLQLFAVYILFKAVVACMIALVIWLLISLSSNMILVSGVAGITAAVQLLLYKNISLQSSFSFFRIFNIFSLFDYKSITEYNLVSFFSLPVRADIIMWAILFMISAALSVGLVLCSGKNYPIKTPVKALSVLQKFLKKLSVLYSKAQSFFYAGRFETFKIMHIGKGLLVVIVFILILGFGFNTNQLVFSSTEVFLNDYYEQYGGILDQEIYNSVDNMKLELEKVQAEFDLKAEQYSKGEITLEEYELATAKHTAYDTQRKAVDILTQQISRIERLSDKGIEPVLINELGYKSLFHAESNHTEIMLLICMVVILFSSVFSVEKASNMILLNHCSKNGRRQLYFKKICTVIPKAFILTFISYAVFFMQNNYLYKLANFNADIHNLECLCDIGFNMSAAEYIILNFCFEFLFVTLTALIVAALSAFMPQLAVIILSACVFLLPGALYMINIPQAKSVSVSYLFNFNALLLDKGFSITGLAGHFVIIIFCTVLLCFCQRQWCATKDR